MKFKYFLFVVLVITSKLWSMQPDDLGEELQLIEVSKKSKSEEQDLEEKISTPLSLLDLCCITVVNGIVDIIKGDDGEDVKKQSISSIVDCIPEYLYDKLKFYMLSAIAKGDIYYKGKAFHLGFNTDHIFNDMKGVLVLSDRILKTERGGDLYIYSDKGHYLKSVNLPRMNNFSSCAFNECVLSKDRKYFARVLKGPHPAHLIQRFNTQDYSLNSQILFSIQNYIPVCMSDDNRYILFGTQEGFVAIIDFETGKQFRVEIYNALIRTMYLSNDNQFLLTIHEGYHRQPRVIKICRLEYGSDRIASKEIFSKTYDTEMRCVGICFSSKYNRLIAIEQGKEEDESSTMKIYSFPELECLSETVINASSACRSEPILSFDEKYIIVPVVDEQGCNSDWDFAEEVLLISILENPGKMLGCVKTMFSKVFFMPLLAGDDSVIVAAVDDNWETTQTRELYKLNFNLNMPLRDLVDKLVNGNSTDVKDYYDNMPDFEIETSDEDSSSEDENASSISSEEEEQGD